MANVYKSEGAVYRLLESRYPVTEYALFSQVADDVGFAKKSWADAIMFGLWPSRGNEIEGFEIKVSRSDWLSELKKHEKSSPVQAYCHRWWIVAGSRDIVDPDELPKTWGLLIPRGKGLESKVKAPLLKPKKLSRKFVTAVMRRSAESFERRKKSIYAEQYKIAAEDAKKIAVNIAKEEIRIEQGDLRRKVQRLEMELGRANSKINDYEALKRVIGMPMQRYELQRLLQNAAIIKATDSALKLHSLVDSIKNSVDLLDNAADRAEAYVDGLEIEETKE
jgi:hypothetical protein